MPEAIVRAGLVIGIAVIIALATRLSGLMFFAIALTICCVLGATLWTRCFHAGLRACLADPQWLPRSDPPCVAARSAPAGPRPRRELLR